MGRNSSAITIFGNSKTSTPTHPATYIHTYNYGHGRDRGSRYVNAARCSAARSQLARWLGGKVGGGPARHGALTVLALELAHAAAACAPRSGLFGICSRVGFLTFRP